MSDHPSYTRIFVLPQASAAPVGAAFARSFSPLLHASRSSQVDSESSMSTWFKRQTAVVDAIVAANVTFACLWFFQALHGAGMAALGVGIFGLFQLLRFVNAQIGELQWVQMHEALLRDKSAPEPPRGDGYREAALVEELPSPDDTSLEEEVPRRRRRAQLSLGIAGGLVWLATLVPGFVLGIWQIAGAATFVAAVTALFLWTMRVMRRKERELSRDDYFIRHLDRDTEALLDKKPRVRIDADANLRVGVDFGVPAEQLDASDEPAPPAAAHRNRDPA